MKYLQGISIAQPQWQSPAHNAWKFCTVVQDDISGVGQKEHIILLYTIIVWMGGRSHWKRGNVCSLAFSPTVLIPTFSYGHSGSDLAHRTVTKKKHLTKAGKKLPPTRVRPSWQQLLCICVLTVSSPEFHLICSSSNIP